MNSLIDRNMKLCKNIYIHHLQNMNINDFCIEILFDHFIYQIREYKKNFYIYFSDLKIMVTNVTNPIFIDYFDYHRNLNNCIIDRSIINKIDNDDNIMILKKEFKIMLQNINEKIKCYDNILFFEKLCDKMELTESNQIFEICDDIIKILSNYYWSIYISMNLANKKNITEINNLLEKIYIDFTKSIFDWPEIFDSDENIKDVCRSLIDSTGYISCIDLKKLEEMLYIVINGYKTNVQEIKNNYIISLGIENTLNNFDGNIYKTPNQLILEKGNDIIFKIPVELNKSPYNIKIKEILKKNEKQIFELMLRMLEFLVLKNYTLCDKKYYKISIDRLIMFIETSIEVVNPKISTMIESIDIFINITKELFTTLKLKYIENLNIYQNLCIILFNENKLLIKELNFLNDRDYKINESLRIKLINISKTFYLKYT